MPVAAVFCSAREIKKYYNLATEAGKMLAQLDYKVVYGGGYQGLMGKMAKGVESEDGWAEGYSTYYLHQREISEYNLVTTHFVHTMGERKQIQLTLADVVIILPGGFGTLDELFETLTFSQLELTRIKKIFILDPEMKGILEDLIEVQIKRGTISPKDADIISFIKDVKHLEDNLRLVKYE